MILKFVRVLKIVRVAIRYGLDEIAISHLAVPRLAKLIDTMIFWRDVSEPPGERLRRCTCSHQLARTANRRQP